MTVCLMSDDSAQPVLSVPDAHPCLTDPAGPAVNVWDPVSLMSLIPAPASSALLMSATPAGTVPNAPWKNLSTAQSLLIGIMMP